MRKGDVDTSMDKMSARARSGNQFTVPLRLLYLGWMGVQRLHSCCPWYSRIFWRARGELHSHLSRKRWTQDYNSPAPPLATRSDSLCQASWSRIVSSGLTHPARCDSWGKVWGSQASHNRSLTWRCQNGTTCVCRCTDPDFTGQTALPPPKRPHHTETSSTTDPGGRVWRLRCPGCRLNLKGNARAHGTTRRTEQPWNWSLEEVDEFCPAQRCGERRRTSSSVSRRLSHSTLVTLKSVCGLRPRASRMRTACGGGAAPAVLERPSPRGFKLVRTSLDAGSRLGTETMSASTAAGIITGIVALADLGGFWDLASSSISCVGK